MGPGLIRWVRKQIKVAGMASDKGLAQLMRDDLADAAAADDALRSRIMRWRRVL